MDKKGGELRVLEAKREQSIMTVYEEHFDTVYRFVYRRCRDHDLAEDITQETFVAAVHSPQNPSEITIAWLQTVARNKLVDLLRRNINYEEKLRVIANSLTESSDTDPTDRLRVEEALGRLPVNYRLVLTLHYLTGMTVPAIAKQLDRSVKSVEALTTRARRALASELEDDNYDDSTGGAS